MSAYVALLRAVNLGGTSTLPMTVLAELCRSAGFTDVATYIASGNVVFRSRKTEAQVRSALEKQLQAWAGKPIGVVVRTAAEIADVAARNPFPDAPGSTVVVLFFDGAMPTSATDGVSGIGREELRLGTRELFILYPDGIGRSRLRVPAASTGTARNMNTVIKLAGMSAALAAAG